MTIEAVDRFQHFAEKLHAFTRRYAAGESSRVKDLVDLIILIEDGTPSSTELVAAVDHVFAVRGTHPVPAEIPDAPINWSEPYAALATDLNLSQTSTMEAVDVLRAFWSHAAFSGRGGTPPRGGGAGYPGPAAPSLRMQPQTPAR